MRAVVSGGAGGLVIGDDLLLGLGLHFLVVAEFFAVQPAAAGEFNGARCRVGLGLDIMLLPTSLPSMSTIITAREFIRDFPRSKRTVANGGEISIRDRQGRSYVFCAKDTVPSLGEQLADLCGKHNTGVRVKRQVGFGKSRK